MVQLFAVKSGQVEISSQMDQSIQSELVKNAPAVSYAFSVTDVDVVCLLNSIIDCTRFSSVTRLFRVTVLVLCVISKSQTNRPNSNKRCNYKQSLPVQLNIEEISAAEILWIQFIQVNAFQAEIKFLLTNLPNQFKWISLNLRLMTTNC